MLTIGDGCRFRMVRPSDTVNIVIVRREAGDLSHRARRYLTADFQGKRPVLVTFTNRADAIRMARPIEARGDRYVCSLAVNDAAWLSFNELQMDMIIVYQTEEWEIGYCKRA